jgi:hypothetical protein
VLANCTKYYRKALALNLSRFTSRSAAEAFSEQLRKNMEQLLEHQRQHLEALQAAKLQHDEVLTGVIRRHAREIEMKKSEQRGVMLAVSLVS